MKILFVVPYVPSPIRVRPYNFLKQMAPRHEIAVVANSTAGDAEDVERLRALCRRVYPVSLSVSASIRGCVAALMRGEPLQSGFCRSPELDRTVRALLGDEQFDVVHVEHLRAAHVEGILPEALPNLFDSVDSISLLLERTLKSSHSLGQRVIAGLEIARCRAYEARLVRRFDRVVVTSTEDASALGKLASNGKISVIPNGVDLDHFRPLSEQREEHTLVFSGKMSYHANVTALLHFVRHIYPLVKAAKPGVCLRVSGSRPPAVVRNLTRDPSISVSGYVPDIRQELARASVAVCPVIVKVGIQNKVLEAMAMGIPVVSTPQGVTGLDVVPERDLLVAADPEDFAERVCRLLGDQKLRTRISEAGLQYVKTFHRWDRAAAQLERAYDQVMRAGTSRAAASEACGAGESGAVHRGC